MTAPVFATFGCRLNAYETEAMKGLAAAAGVADAVVVNSCAVTGEAVRQARQTIRKLRRQHPDRRIIVTGCAAQLTPRSFAEMPEVDRVLGNAEKLNRAHLAGDGAPVVVSDIMRARQTASHLLDGFEGRARAFVEVQQGCDHRCTFCIIPFARGPNRGVPEPLVTARVRQLVANGYREIVLTGVDICSWGAGIPGRPKLGGLVQAIRQRPGAAAPAALDARPRGDR